MGKNKRPKAPTRADILNLYSQAKGRQRIRSTYFEDEIQKAERRENRKQNEKKMIDEQLQEESDLKMMIDSDCDTMYCGGCYMCTPHDVWEADASMYDLYDDD